MVHGFYSALEEAQREARSVVQSRPDIQACVVDHCYRWLPVCVPSRDTAEAEEEVGAPENNAPQSGRMGSTCVSATYTQGRGGVCDLRGGASLEGAPAAVTLEPGPSSPYQADNTVVRREQASRKRETVEARTVLRRG